MTSYANDVENERVNIEWMCSLLKIDLNRFLGYKNQTFKSWNTFSKNEQFDSTTDSFIFNAISILIKWHHDFKNLWGILKLYYNQKSPKNSLGEVRTPYCSQINNTCVGFMHPLTTKLEICHRIPSMDRYSDCQGRSQPIGPTTFIAYLLQ